MDFSFLVCSMNVFNFFNLAIKHFPSLLLLNLFLILFVLFYFLYVYYFTFVDFFYLLFYIHYYIDRYFFIFIFIFYLLCCTLNACVWSFDRFHTDRDFDKRVILDVFIVPTMNRNCLWSLVLSILLAINKFYAHCC